MSNSGGDVYPGDAKYTQIILKIRQMVLSNGIDYSQHWKQGVRGRYSRKSLVDLLSTRFDEVKGAGEKGASNAGYLGKAIDKDACEKALNGTLGGFDGWAPWAGTHKGSWFDDAGKTFKDNAIWASPHSEPSKVKDDDRTYQVQPVTWPHRPKMSSRHGWNQSHAQVPYVWGWDPKEGGHTPGQEGTIGAVCGFPFKTEGVFWILWVTLSEAFLEGITTTNPRRKISTGMSGIGQWVVT